VRFVEGHLPRALHLPEEARVLDAPDLVGRAMVGADKIFIGRREFPPDPKGQKNDLRATSKRLLKRCATSDDEVRQPESRLPAGTCSGSAHGCTSFLEAGVDFPTVRTSRRGHVGQRRANCRVRAAHETAELPVAHAGHTFLGQMLPDMAASMSASDGSEFSESKAAACVICPDWQ
jgi:hypothetical protein